ncbi:transposase domain-containing protein [Streptomyces sp. NPDC014724]|uniref:transposase domain-containing protein n=1 Tax=unclassified Streptomyces TaxID=2593676 RepID=UPI0036FCF3A0
MCRLRDLPSRVGVYFVLAMCLFPEVGYRLVWQKLTAALTGAGLDTVRPTEKALRDLRRQIGAAPVRHLFDVVAGPLARPTTRGVRFGPFRTVSFDGCSSIKIPESDRNVDRFGPQSRGGYPMVELMTLVETGTRALIGAAFGLTSVGETDYANGTVRMWDLATGQQVAPVLSFPAPVHAVAVAPGGELLAGFGWVLASFSLPR